MTAILFDFFGTLVTYSPSRTEQGFPRSHALLPHLAYPEFLSVVDAAFARLDARSDLDDREFSMREGAAAILGVDVSDPAAAEFERVYIQEWSAPVAPVPGVAEFLTGLRDRHRLAVVSNTHSPTMIPGLLAAWGWTALFDAVVLSVDVGFRKPHPTMYATALAALSVPASEAVFVGDSLVPDHTGPTAAGIDSYLIDPAGVTNVPPAARLTSVLDLQAGL